MNIEALTATTFAQKITETKGVALVDFWAPWCMPCLRVAPILEEMAQEFEGKVTVGTVNVDQQQAVAQQLGITGIPAVCIFRDGKVVDRLVGVRPAQAYRAALKTALLAGGTAPATAKATTANEGAKKAPGHSVTVFSTPTCSWCVRLKTYLKQHAITFKDVDVSKDERAANDMVRRSGQMGVPQAWIDGQVIVGFDRGRIDTLLGL